MQKTNDRRPPAWLAGSLCVLLGGVFWGFSGACGQYLFLRYQADSLWLTSVRMLVAGVLVTAFGFLRDRKSTLGLLRSRRDLLQTALFAIFGLLFCQYTYLTTIAYSNAGTATVLEYIGPVFIMVYVCLRRRRPPNAREFASILLALAGTFILATHGNPSTMALSPQALAWGLVSAVALALYTLLPVGLIRRWGSVPATGLGMLIGGLALALAGVPFRNAAALELRGLLAMGGVVIIGTVIGYTLYLQGVKLVGSVKASMLASIEPVSATLFATLWLGSPFTWMDLIGYACILTTVFLLARRE